MLLAALGIHSRKIEAEAVSRELRSARIELESTSSQLVKTLDEMLEETNRANRRQQGGANYHVSISKPREDH